MCLQMLQPNFLFHSARQQGSVQVAKCKLCMVKYRAGQMLTYRKKIFKSGRLTDAIGDVPKKMFITYNLCSGYLLQLQSSVLSAIIIAIRTFHQIVLPL